MNAKALAEKLNVPYQINPPFKDFDAIVCLDFNKSSMIGSKQNDFLAFEGEKFLIDHYVEDEEKILSKNNSFTSTKAVSATELVYELLKKSKQKIPKESYACIGAGIITDSSSFLIADHKTFGIMSEVMEKDNIPYSYLIDLIKVRKDFSEKIASLKAAKRARIFKFNDVIIAISDVGSFEAESASALIRLGADVAFCGFSEKNLIRISARVNNAWRQKTKFDLAKDVLNNLGKHFPGKGGGHAGAAGFNGSGDDVSKHLEKCVELTKDFLAKKEKGNLKEYT